MGRFTDDQRALAEIEHHLAHDDPGLDKSCACRCVRALVAVGERAESVSCRERAAGTRSPR